MKRAEKIAIVDYVGYLSWMFPVNRCGMVLELCITPYEKYVFSWMVWVVLSVRKIALQLQQPQMEIIMDSAGEKTTRCKWIEGTKRQEDVRIAACRTICKCHTIKWLCIVPVGKNICSFCMHFVKQPLDFRRYENKWVHFVNNAKPAYQPTEFPLKIIQKLWYFIHVCKRCYHNYVDIVITKTINHTTSQTSHSMVVMKLCTM